MEPQHDSGHPEEGRLTADQQAALDQVATYLRENPERAGSLAELIQQQEVLATYNIDDELKRIIQEVWDNERDKPTNQNRRPK